MQPTKWGANVHWKLLTTDRAAVPIDLSRGQSCIIATTTKPLYGLIPHEKAGRVSSKRDVPDIKTAQRLTSQSSARSY